MIRSSVEVVDEEKERAGGEFVVCPDDDDSGRLFLSPSNGALPAAFGQKKLRGQAIRLIKKDTDYAVKALLYISQQDDARVSAAELSRRLRIPYPYLRTILQTLNTKGILASFRGKGGGFALARAPEDIYLTELIKILQGPVTLADCIFRSRVCPGIRTCRLRKITLRLQKILIAELRSVTLASMLRKPASRRKRGGNT